MDAGKTTLLANLPLRLLLDYLVESKEDAMSVIAAATDRPKGGMFSKPEETYARLLASLQPGRMLVWLRCDQAICMLAPPDSESWTGEADVLRKVPVHRSTSCLGLKTHIKIHCGQVSWASASHTRFLFFPCVIVPNGTRNFPVTVAFLLQAARRKQSSAD